MFCEVVLDREMCFDPRRPQSSRIHMAPQLVKLVSRKPVQVPTLCPPTNQISHHAPRILGAGLVDAIVAAFGRAMVSASRSK